METVCFLKNSFRNTIRVSNSLDPDQARHFVGPDLVSNCLQRLSADGTSWQLHVIPVLKMFFLNTLSACELEAT